MKIAVLGARNLYKLFTYLEGKGYRVVESTNMVLGDNSEIGEWEIRDREDRVVGRIIAHYIRQYYAAMRELPGNASDREILERLLKAKYFEEKWSSPVEPVLIIGEDKVASVLNEYQDDYPNDKARMLVEQYFIDGGVRVMTRLAKKMIENVGKQTSTTIAQGGDRGGDEGSISRKSDEGSTG